MVDHRRPRRSARRRSACRPSRAAPASTTTRRRSGQQSLRTAWHAHARRGRPRALGRDHFLGDDLDEPLQILWVQHRLLRIAVFEPADLQQAAGCSAPRASPCRARRRRCGSRRRCPAAASSRASSRWRRCARASSARSSRRCTSPRGSPRTLLAAIADPMPGAVDDDAGVGLPARDRARHRAGDVGIVDRRRCRRCPRSSRPAPRPRRCCTSAASAPRRCGRCRSRRAGCRRPAPDPPAAPDRRDPAGDDRDPPRRAACPAPAA